MAMFAKDHQVQSAAGLLLGMAAGAAVGTIPQVWLAAGGALASLMLAWLAVHLLRARKTK